MFNFVMTLVLVLGLVFGGSGATVAAAQSSLPDGALYSIKLWSEEARLQLAGDSESQFQLMLAFTNRRMEEVQTMLQAGDPVSESVMTRLQEQLQRELQFAANQPDPTAEKMLLQIRDQLRTRERTFQQLQLKAGDEIGQVVRAQVQAMLEHNARLAEQGAENPIQLRDQLREQDRLQQQDQTCQETDCEPAQEQNQQQQQNQNGTATERVEPAGGNPWTTDTPTPGSSYGPGESQNPWTDATPTPGSGYGPGTQPTGVVEPSGTPDQCGSCTPQQTPDPTGTGIPNPGGNNGTPQGTPDPIGTGTPQGTPQGNKP